MSPAIEGVQQAHGRLLALRGTRLHDRADHHLDQSAARRVVSAEQDPDGGSYIWYRAATLLVSHWLI